MMIEQNTNYAYKLKYMDNPTFDKVRDLSTKFYRELPKALQEELFEALNHGIDILDSEPQMTAYLYAFGKMHQAKLNYAFDKLPKVFFEQPEINIIDYGCGQALGTMCYADFLRENGYMQKAKTIALIEPSEICLKRATLHASVFFPDAAIKTVNKKFDDLTQNDIVCSEKTPTLHIFSNVLDMLDFDIDKFANLLNGCLKGYNQFVCVGPYFKHSIKDERMAKFRTLIQVKKYFFKTFDKNEFVKDKDWTAQLLCFSIGEFAQNTQMKQQDLILVGEYSLETYKAKFNCAQLDFVDNPKKEGSMFFRCGFLPNGLPNYGAIGEKANAILNNASLSERECVARLRISVYKTFVTTIENEQEVKKEVLLPILQANNTVATDEDIANGVEDEFGVVYTEDGKRLLKCKNHDLVVYNIKDGTKVICNDAFLGHISLQQITIPNSIEQIGDNPFRGCDKLKIESKSLKFIVTNELLINIQNNTIISYFSKDRKLTIPNSVKSIGRNAFSRVETLLYINIPESVISIENGAFFGCESLQQVTIPNSVISIGNFAFACCSSLQQITIPNSVMHIGHDIFFKCKSLRQIIIPENCVEKFKQLLPEKIWNKLYYLQNASNDYSDDCCFTIF